MKNNQIIQSLKFLVQLGKAYEDLCQDWLQGVGLAGRSLNGANFSLYHLNWKNLKGTDFRNCDLRYSNFEGVIGGFSIVRPIILLSAICLSIATAFEVSPKLNQIYQPLQEFNVNYQNFAFISMFFLGVVVYLKMFLTLLYQVKLSPKTVQVDDARLNPWTTITEEMKILLTILPIWLGMGTYLLIIVAQSLFIESFDIALALMGVALVFGFAAFATFMWIVGHAFTFKTSFVEADLEKVQLTEAKFPGCNFSKANLHSANLRRGDFRNCNFKEADLRFADFRGANLQGANFKNAKKAGAIGLKKVVTYESE